MYVGKSSIGESSPSDGMFNSPASIDCRYSQVSNQKLALLNTLKYSVWSSRGAGLVLAMDGFLIMLAVCRNLITWLRPKIRFLPLDENLWFHRQTAYMLLLFTIIHATAHYVNFFVPLISGRTDICRLLKRFVRDPSLRCRSIMQMPEGSLAMSCYFACYLCIRLPMRRFANNPSKRSGTRTTLRLSLFWHCTRMQRGVLYGIQRCRTVRSPANCSGHIVLVMRDGD